MRLRPKVGPVVRMNPVCRTCNRSPATYPDNCTGRDWCVKEGPLAEARKVRAVSRIVRPEQSVRKRIRYDEEGNRIGGER